MREKLEILFEDEEIAVVIKPSGILSQGDRANNPDMVKFLKSHIAIEGRKKGLRTKEEPYIGVVHRLDRNVRGIMVYAKTKNAARELSEQIAKNKVKKKYACIIDLEDENSLQNYEKVEKLEHFLSYEPRVNLTKIAENGKGDRALLEYRVVKKIGKEALVEVWLITGRKHQIRVQMAEISYGIKGDIKYNKRRMDVGEKSIPALECIGLSFVHPVTKEYLEFETSPKGSDFIEFL